MAMSPATMSDTLQLVLKLLNERFPLLVRDGDATVRERVAFARLTGAGAGRDGGTAGTARRLEIETYRHRRIVVEGVQSAEVEVKRRDAQGVPLEYEVVLVTSGGPRRLLFFA